MSTFSLGPLRTLSQRERRIVMIGAPIAALLFVLAVVLPLERNVTRLHQQVARKQTDLAWMRRVAPELSAAGAPRGASSQPLIVLVDRSAHQAGLGHDLSASTPDGAKRLRVSLRRAPFDAMIGWLAHLHRQYGVQVQSASIRRSGQTGEVDASLVLGTP